VDFEARAALRLGGPSGEATTPFVLAGPPPPGGAASVGRLGALNAWAPWRHRAPCVAAAVSALAEGVEAEGAVLVAAVPGDAVPEEPRQLRTEGAPDMGLPEAPAGAEIACGACTAAHAALSALGFRVTLVLCRGFRPPGRDLAGSRRTAAKLGSAVGAVFGLEFAPEPTVAAAALDFAAPAGHADPDFPNMYV